VDWRGRTAEAVICPLDPGWRAYYEEAMRIFSGEEFRVIWIDDDIRRVFTEGHREGAVHSVETWDASGQLVGGLYGVSLWGLFAGESMFHDPVRGRDASKVALARLVGELRDRPDGTALLDVQWLTGHLARLGGSEISRVDYLGRLDVGPAPAGRLADGADRLRGSYADKP
jgi:leucyl/phenylalanyl-tRNA--protein transferase